MAAIVDAVLLTTTTRIDSSSRSEADDAPPPQHRQWMTRSYAVALTFFQIRFILGVMGLDQPPSFAVTEIVVWSCVALAVLVGDLANQWYELQLTRPRRARAAARLPA